MRNTSYQRVQEATCSDLCPCFANRGVSLVCNARALLSKSGCARNFVFPYLSNLTCDILSYLGKKTNLVIFQKGGLRHPSAAFLYWQHTAGELYFFLKLQTLYLKPVWFLQQATALQNLMPTYVDFTLPVLHVLTVAHVYKVRT